MATQRKPEIGLCICAHGKAEHVNHDERMERLFVGQIWDGCRACTCPMFRQEDGISIAMQCNALRYVPEQPDRRGPPALSSPVEDGDT